MELWIRSQDRECLMKVDRVDYDNSATLHRILANGYKVFIGKYPTKERALEVLDEIQNKIRPEYMLRSINRPDEPSQYEGYYEEKPTIIYEMPEE